jgi:hypothetical protein
LKKRLKKKEHVNPEARAILLTSITTAEAAVNSALKGFLFPYSCS